MQEPPINDLWTVPGEAHLLEVWQAEDTATFEAVDATSHYHYMQVQDFLRSILDDREPMVTGREGRVRPFQNFKCTFAAIPSVFPSVIG